MTSFNSTERTLILYHTMHISRIQPAAVYGSNEEHEHTNDFGEFLSAQRDSGKLGADPAKPPAQDPFGLLTAGRVFPV